MNTRASLIHALKSYKTDFAEEHGFLSQFTQLLEHPRAYYRDHLPGHITGSAWIIDPSKKFTLLTHHAKLNRWLQPGGHADGDEDVFNVALREAEEETGVRSFNLPLPGIFDIDIHTIPERNNFPEHLHFDVRVLLEVSKDEALIITDESHDLAWVQLDQLDSLTKGNQSILRMAAKVKVLLSA